MKDDKQAIQSALREVVELLVSQDYDRIEKLTGGSRLSANEIEQGIRDYGRTLVSPPLEAYELADVIQISNSAPPEYSIRFRLYTKEEGRSDLEIQATLKKQAGSMVIELDNILVA